MLPAPNHCHLHHCTHHCHPHHLESFFIHARGNVLTCSVLLADCVCVCVLVVHYNSHRNILFLWYDNNRCFILGRNRSHPTLTPNAHAPIQAHSSCDSCKQIMWINVFEFLNFFISSNLKSCQQIFSCCILFWKLEKQHFSVKLPAYACNTGIRSVLQNCKNLDWCIPR